MLERVLSAWRRVLGQPEASGVAARQRLRLVLVQDRTALPADAMESMKNDLVDVVSRYVAIERDSVEVEVRRSPASATLVANMPLAKPGRLAPEHTSGTD